MMQYDAQLQPKPLPPVAIARTGQKRTFILACFVLRFEKVEVGAPPMLAIAEHHFALT